MSNSYIPSNDVQFHTWLDRFMSYLSANLEKFGLTANDFLDLENEGPEFAVKLNSYHDSRTVAKAACRAKNDQRELVEDITKALVARVQAHPDTTNDDREQLGIPLRGVSTTPQEVPLLDSRPSAVIDIRPSRKHVLRIHDETDVGPFRRKPHGVYGCEIWVKIGNEPPTSDAELIYVKTSTKNPCLVEFGAEDVGKQAYYRLRWISRDGRVGDWAEIDTATIAA